MLRFLVTAMACLLLGQTTDALLLGNPLPSTVAVSANARVASSAAMMAKKPAAKSKLITILLEADVEGVGLKGEIIEVKPAYGENTIIAKGLGSKATKEQIQQAEADKLAKEAAALAAKKRAEDAKQTIFTKYGNKGLVIERMFSLQGEMDGGAVTAEEVANVLKSAGVAIEPANVTMDPIEAIGDSAVAAVNLHPEVSTSVKVVLQKSKITIS